MWLATRHEGFDGDVPTHRRPFKRAMTFMDKVINGHLRWGLLLQFLSITGLIVSHYIFEGEGFYTWDLRHSTPKMRADIWYRLTLLCCSALYLVGTIYKMGFQCFLADDSAWARGYRAGSKFLGYATFFDLLGAVFWVSGALNLWRNYDETYWTHFKEGNLDWIFGAGARVINAIASILYADAFFLLEAYHDEGTNDWHGVMNWFIFFFAGVAEMSVLFLADPSVCVVISWIALLSALVWAMAFEQEVNETTPALEESELCNELEKEVEKFTRNNPLELQVRMAPQQQ